MSIGVIITLIVIGICLLLVEFLITPGVTIAGIAGSILIIAGVVSGYYFNTGKVANLILLSTLVLTATIFITAFKTKTWQKMGLNTSSDSHIENPAANFKVGDAGTTVSRLAPIGQVIINDVIVEAHSLGGYIEPNTEIIIIRTEINKLFVETKSN